jgi:hypothetical protein
MTDIDLEYSPTIRPISRPTRDTPEAALEEALYYADPLHSLNPREPDSITRSAAILAAMPGWSLVATGAEEAVAELARTYDAGIAAEWTRIAAEWERAKLTKGSVMHDVGGVIEVVDALLDPKP